MNQDKFVFTAIDWLASIVATAIATGTICCVVHDARDSKQRTYFEGYCDGVQDMVRIEHAAREQKVPNSNKESK